MGSADQRAAAAGLGSSAPGVLAVSVLAAPVVLPPAVVIVPGLLLLALAERLVGLVAPARPQELVLSTPAAE